MTLTIKHRIRQPVAPGNNAYHRFRLWNFAPSMNKMGKLAAATQHRSSSYNQSSCLKVVTSSFKAILDEGHRNKLALMEDLVQNMNMQKIYKCSSEYLR